MKFMLKIRFYCSLCRNLDNNEVCVKNSILLKFVLKIRYYLRWCRDLNINEDY